MAHHVLGDTLGMAGRVRWRPCTPGAGQRLYNPQQHRSHAFLYGYDSGCTASPLGPGRCGDLGYPGQALRIVRSPLPRPGSCRTPLASPLLPGSINCAGKDRPRKRAAATIALAAEQGFILGRVGHHSPGLVAGRAGAEHVGDCADAPGHRGLAGDGSGAATALLSSPVGRGVWEGRASRRGLRVLAEALMAVHNTGERQHEAELYRPAGGLLKQDVPMRKRRKAVFARRLMWPAASRRSRWTYGLL